MVRYLVTGTPRSGTKYTSVLLSRLGLDCSHEKAFRGLKYCSHVNQMGDSSWEGGFWMEAAKFPTIQVIRAPVNSIASMKNIGWLKDFNQPHFRKIRSVMPSLKDPVLSWEERLAIFWINWNIHIYEFVDLYWHTPDIDPINIMDLYELLEMEPPERDFIERVLHQTPKDINRRKKVIPFSSAAITKSLWEKVQRAADYLNVPLEY